MDLKQELALCRKLVDGTDSLNRFTVSTVLGKALAEIERLESEVAAERHARARERQEYESVSRAMRNQLDTMTDAALRAGIRNALGD